MTISIKKLDDLAYYDKIKDSNELKSYEDLDELYSGKKGAWYDPKGFYSNCFKNGDAIDQVQKGDTSTLNKFCQGFNPMTGEALVEQGAGKNRRPGYDFTQSAPKWISVLWSQADEEKRKVIEDAVRESAKAGVDALNEFGGMTRSGKAGVGDVGCTYAAALYMDFTARPTEDPDTGEEMIDPQLHVHTIIPNTVLCDDGKYRAVDGPTMMRLQGVMAETFHAHLAFELAKQGMTITNEKVAFDNKEIPEEAKEGFSKRSEQVEEAKEALGYNDLDPDQARGLLQRAKTETRAKHSIQSKEDIEDQWKERGIEYGFGQQEAAGVFDRAEGRVKEGGIKIEPPTDEEATEIFKGLLMTESVISDAKARAACLGHFTGRASPAEINKVVNAMLERESVDLAQVGAVKMISSHEMIALERQMVDIAATYKRPNAFDKDLIDRVMEKVKAEKIADGKPMSAQQEEAVRFLAESQDGVVSMVGRAGAGKSYSVAALKEIAGESGWEVIGTSLSWAASRNLADEGKLDSASAIADFTHKLDKGEIKLHDKSLIVVDEAGIVGSRDMHKILAAAEKAGSVVVLTGDPLQIGSVSAGGAFRAILEEKERHGGRPYAELNEVRRQKQEWDKQAGLKLSVGCAEEAIQDYIKKGRDDWKQGDDLGRINILEKRDQARDAMFDKYIGDRFDGTGKSQLMIAKTNKDVDALNLKVHKALQEKGIVGQDVPIKVAAKEKDEDRMFAVGDMIQFRKKSAEIEFSDGEKKQVYNRTRGKILEINGSGEDAKLKVQIFSGDKLSDLTVEISGQDFRSGTLPIEHAYCMTVDSAQGQTFDRAYVMGGEFDRARAYVACTRHREDLNVFTDKDTMHALASRNWSNTEFVNRRDFNNDMALATMAATWAQEKRKITTIDYMRGEMHKAKVVAQTASKSWIRENAQLAYDRLREQNAQCVNPSFKPEDGLRNRRLWNSMKDEFMVVGRKAAEIKDAVADAVKRWGFTIGVTGPKFFQREVIEEAMTGKKKIVFSTPKTREIAEEQRQAKIDQQKKAVADPAKPQKTEVKKDVSSTGRFSKGWNKAEIAALKEKEAAEALRRQQEEQMRRNGGGMRI